MTRLLEAKDAQAKSVEQRVLSVEQISQLSERSGNYEETEVGQAAAPGSEGH